MHAEIFKGMKLVADKMKEETGGILEDVWVNMKKAEEDHLL